MKIKKERVRLSTKAITALKNSYDTKFKNRAEKLENIGEYSFSIILYWNRLEALLKALYYYKNIKDDYPDRLNFINRNWSVLKNAYNYDPENYCKILGNGGKSEGCLWHTRDRISHSNYEIDYDKYEEFKVASMRLTDNLISNFPESYDAAHKAFLDKKRAKRTG
jgi:hypothetical protein